MTTTAQKLRQKHLQKFAPWEADVLLSFATDKSKEFLLTHPDIRINIWQLVRFFYLLRKFRRGVPLAYITHHKEFYGLDFYVNRYTLIPRPDTEILAEEAIKIISSKFSAKAILIDVGTGSGCIPIAIIKTLKNQNIKTFATDISAGALRVAKKNAAFHDVKIEFRRGNLLDSIMELGTENLELVLTANLPYLTAEQFKNEPSLQEEPRTALVAGENGLKLYRELLDQLTKLNKSFTLLVEFDPGQTEELKKIVKQAIPNLVIEIKKDLAGRDRLAIISEKKKSE